jgi:hypothetical protein
VYALAAEEPGQDVWAYQPIHNVPLLLVGEIGLIGFFIVLFILSRLTIINFSRFPAIDAIAAFSMSYALFAVAFFDHYLWSSFSGLALVGFVSALLLRHGNGHPPTASTTGFGSGGSEEWHFCRRPFRKTSLQVQLADSKNARTTT